MRILYCHNYYQQKGGEDRSFADEAELMRAHGHEVRTYTRHNDDVDGQSKLSSALQTLWSRRSYREVRAILREYQPDIMHCTNTFPLISPAAYYAAAAESVPVVQSLRNYRLLCAGAYHLREGKVCEDCVGKFFGWNAVKHACYRDSRAGSAVVAGMLALHRGLGTWTNKVSMYYTLTEFSRQKFIAGGLPPEKIMIKPNFVEPDPGAAAGDGGFVLMVGRLSPEKGLQSVIDAWDKLERPVPLKIVGDGPLGHVAAAAHERHPHIEWLGELPHEKTLDYMGRAMLTVVPSLWYEAHPRTIIESFCRGTPVMAARLGAMAELVDDGETGRHFTPGDADDLAVKVQQVLADPAGLAQMRENARRRYEERHTARANYNMLHNIYKRTLATSGREATAQAPAEPGLAPQPVAR